MTETDNEESQVYIYALLDPRDNKIRYIGKTIQVLSTRLSNHISTAKRGKCVDHKINWIRHLVSLDLVPSIILLNTCSGDEWEEYERAWIAIGKTLGWALTNTTAGGGGVREYSPTQETREKISAALKGRTHSPAHRERLSKVRKGKKHSQQHLDALRASYARRKQETARKKTEACGHLMMVLDEDGSRHHSEAAKQLIGEASKGNHYGATKLNQEKADEIRIRYSCGDTTYSILAKEYEVDTTTIYKIVRNKRWKISA